MGKPRDQWGWQRRPRLAEALGVTCNEWKSILAAGADSGLTVRDYCRVMLVCAAGHKGALKSIERVLAAQQVVDAKTLETLAKREVR